MSHRKTIPKLKRREFIKTASKRNDFEIDTAFSYRQQSKIAAGQQNQQAELPDGSTRRKSAPAEPQ